MVLDVFNTEQAEKRAKERAEKQRLLLLDSFSCFCLFFLLFSLSLDDSFRCCDEKKKLSSPSFIKNLRFFFSSSLFWLRKRPERKKNALVDRSPRQQGRRRAAPRAAHERRVAGRSAREFSSEEKREREWKQNQKKQTPLVFSSLFFVSLFLGPRFPSFDFSSHSSG